MLAQVFVKRARTDTLSSACRVVIQAARVGGSFSAGTLPLVWCRTPHFSSRLNPVQGHRYRCRAHWHVPEFLETRWKHEHMKSSGTARKYCLQALLVSTFPSAATQTHHRFFPKANTNLLVRAGLPPTLFCHDFIRTSLLFFFEKCCPNKKSLNAVRVSPS